MKPASSISCDAVRRSASSFLDGRMSARERGAAQRHLRACTACMGELQQLARLSRAMHNLPPHRVADGMAQRLRRQHDGSLATPADRSVTQWAAPRGSRIARRIAAAALAAAALPLVFWLGYRSGRAAARAAARRADSGRGCRVLADRPSARRHRRRHLPCSRACAPPRRRPSWTSPRRRGRTRPRSLRRRPPRRRRHPTPASRSTRTPPRRTPRPSRRWTKCTG
ncbi:MAG: zf-HC2 domain-containing protein [Planctomycetes bacterium]|nr:zf-HC2 domain-containing protein [Planctomycetota bacterium]